MNNRAFFLFVILPCVLPNRSGAVEITSRIVDGLGRPVSDVTVEIKYPKRGPDGNLGKIEWLKMISDKEGRIKVVYDQTLVPTNQTMWIYVKKIGYASFSTDSLKPEYVLRREFDAEDVHRIADLSGEIQKQELKEVLVGEFKNDGKHVRESLEELVFYYGRVLRRPLRELIEDSKTGIAACSLLAFLGVPKDLRLVVKNAPAAKRELFQDRWAYGVVCALLEPATKEEWDFLKRCAANEYDDLWVDAGAIRTLRLIGSTQSVDILTEAAKKNTDRKESFRYALDYIKNGPLLLQDPDLEEAGKKIAQAVKIGVWKGNKNPRYNKEKDMALIDCEFVSGRDLLVQTATFHKVGTVWKLRGVRETMQALLANPPERKSFAGVWQGFSQDQLEFARLELNENGTGLLAISFLPTSPPEKYFVTKWTLKDFQVEFAIEPAEPGAEPVALENVILGLEDLECVLRPVHGGDWSRKMTLFNEKALQERSERARKALEPFRKHH